MSHVNSEIMTVCEDCGNEEPGSYGDCGACGSSRVVHSGGED